MKTATGKLLTAQYLTPKNQAAYHNGFHPMQANIVRFFEALVVEHKLVNIAPQLLA